MELFTECYLPALNHFVNTDASGTLIIFADSILGAKETISPLITGALGAPRRTSSAPILACSELFLLQRKSACFNSYATLLPCWIATYERDTVGPQGIEPCSTG